MAERTWSEVELDEFRQVIDGMFALPSTLDMWQGINNAWAQLGFTDEISDRDRIEENNYIVMQYRKYVFSHEKEIRAAFSKGGPEGLMEFLQGLIGKLTDTPSIRREALYQLLRNDWLIQFYNIFSQMVEPRFNEETDF